MSIERGNWTKLKPRRRWLPWGRWRVLTRLRLAQSKRARLCRNEARLRSMRMMREMGRGGSVKLYSREAGWPGGFHMPAFGGSTPPPATFSRRRGKCLEEIHQDRRGREVRPFESPALGNAGTA